MSEIIVGNMAKCRDALVEVNGALDNIMDYDVDGVLHRCVSIIKQALAEPPRNCDVGTAEAQTARYNKFCYKNKTTERSCGDCPAYSAYAILKKDCRLAWAQMPYEEGGEE